MSIGRIQRKHDLNYLCFLSVFCHPLSMGGRHEKPQSIDLLCNIWTRTSLWNLAKGRANKLGDTASNNQHFNLVDMPVSFGKCGRLGKACRTLLPGSIAPNNKTTWQLLNTKNPIGHLPSLHMSLQTFLHLTQPLILHQS